MLNVYDLVDLREIISQEITNRRDAGIGVDDLVHLRKKLTAMLKEIEDRG